MRAAAVLALLALGPGGGEDRPYGVAADRAVVATVQGREVRVGSQPFEPGAARTPIGTITVPRGQSAVNATVHASDQRVAVALDTEDGERNLGYTGVFAGALTGPLEPLVPLAAVAKTRRFTAAAGVDGIRVFTSTFQDDFRSVAYLVHEPGVPDRVPRVPRRAFAVFAGELAAYPARGALVVRNWMTGALVRRVEPFDPDRGFDLRADGALAFVRDRVLYTAAPGGPVVRRARAGANDYGGLAWAGDRVVLNRTKRLEGVEPDGTKRRLGPRSASIDGLVAGGDRVMWTANDCVLAARVTDGPADAPGPGPCARTEMNDAYFPVRRGGVVRFRLRCIAGPAGVCRGTLGLRRDGRAGSPERRFRLRAGTATVVPLPGRGGVVRRTTIDPGGRRFVERFYVEP